MMTLCDRASFEITCTGLGHIRILPSLGLASGASAMPGLCFGALPSRLMTQRGASLASSSSRQAPIEEGGLDRQAESGLRAGVDALLSPDGRRHRKGMAGASIGSRRSKACCDGVGRAVSPSAPLQYAGYQHTLGQTLDVLRAYPSLSPKTETFSRRSSSDLQRKRKGLTGL